MSLARGEPTSPPVPHKAAPRFGAFVAFVALALFVATLLAMGAGWWPGWFSDSRARELDRLVDRASYRKAKIYGQTLDPTFLNQHAILWARILRLNSDLVLAGEFLKKATPADPLWSQIEMERGLLRLENGELADNLELAMRLADARPELRDRIYEGAVRAYLRQLLPGPAGELLKRWQREQPGLLYRLEAAHLHDFLDDPEGCLTELEIAKTLSPHNPEIDGWIGKCQSALQHNQAARENLEYALGLLGHQSDWELALAVVLDRLGLPDEAIALLSAILERDPGEGQALAQRGRIFLQNQSPAKAQTDLQMALRVEPGNTIAADNLRKALFELGKTDEARELGLRIPQMEKDQKRIRELIQVEIQKKPNDPDVMHELAAIFLRSGYPKSAIFWVRKALLIAPNHVPSHELMAGYYEATGNPGLAAEHRQKTSANPSRPSGVGR